MHLHLYGKKLKDVEGFMEIDTPWAYQEGHTFNKGEMKSLYKRLISDILFVDVTGFAERKGVVVESYFGDNTELVLNNVDRTIPNIKHYITMMHRELLEYTISLLDDHIHEMIKALVDSEFNDFEKGEIMEQ